MTLTELLVSLLLSVVVGGALFSIFVNTFQSHDFVTGQGHAETDSRTPLDIMVDHIRNAQQYKFGGTNNVYDYRVIDQGTKTSVTYYRTNSATDTVRYYLDGTNLKRQEGNATPTVVMKNVASLELRYFKTPTNAGNYNNASVVPTTDAFQPTTAELPYLKAIQIRGKVLIGGYQRELTGLVRLRNSPRKVRI